MVTSFPFGNDLINAAFLFFRGTAQTLVSFVPLIFIVRLILLKLSLGGARDYGDLLKDLIFLYIGFFMFSEIMEFVMKVPEIAEMVINKPSQPKIAVSENTGGLFYYFFNIKEVDLMNLLSSLVYWLVCFVYLIIMFFMIATGAYIILFSTLFKMRWMMGAYLTLVLILSMWPFVWYAIDQAFVFTVDSLKDSGSGMASLVALFVGIVIKLSVPIIGGLAAMKVPVGVGSSIKSAVIEGSRPIASSASFAGGSVKKVNSMIGMDKAVESFRSDPISKENNRAESDKKKRFKINDSMPLVAFGAHKALSKIRSNKDNLNKVNNENFSEFSRKNEIKHHQRQIIKIDKKISGSKKIDQSKFASLKHSQEVSLKKLGELHTNFNSKSSNSFTRENHQKIVGKVTTYNQKSALNDSSFLNKNENNSLVNEKKFKKRWKDKEGTV